MGNLRLKTGILFFILLWGVSQAWSQNENFEIIQANELEGTEINAQPVRKLRKDVILKQGNTTLFCDSAFQYVNTNFMEAFGRVRVQQGDSVTLWGDHLTYYPETKKCLMVGNVILQDKKMTLTTPNLEYFMDTKQSFYYGGGKIVDATSVLTSERGYYNSLTKIFTFKKNVRYKSTDFSVETDTMMYHTSTKMITFRAPTKIISKDGTLYADAGEYDTVKKKSNFRGRAKVETPDYNISGDSLFYDEKNKFAIARRNVVMTSAKDSSIIEGEYALYRGKGGISRVHGRPVMKNISGGDTLFLLADTLVSVNDSIAKKKMLLAFNHVRIFRNDLRGICDSLVYNRIDSMFSLFRDPVLWNEGNQITADTIFLHMANKQIDRMRLRTNAYTVSRDSLWNFNQAKGKNMVAYFKNNKMKTIDIRGNGESLYFSVEGDTLLTGMNKVLCSNMLIKFKENNKLSTITFINKPDGKFVPPHEINEPDKRLKGFKWREKEKPQRKDFNRTPKVVVSSKALK